MISKKLLYNENLNEIILMSVYSTDDVVTWVFEFDDMEMFTTDVKVAMEIVFQFEQIGDL